MSTSILEQYQRHLLTADPISWTLPENVFTADKQDCWRETFQHPENHSFMLILG